MSLEWQIRRAFWRMVWWRLLGDLIEVPGKIADALATMIAAVFGSFAKTVFYFELEAARNYKTLTGTDLGYAVGETSRYGGLSADRAERAQRAMVEGPLIQFDDDEDDL